MWALGDRMKERDIKYAVKAGMATAILAAPAFFSTTRPMFVQYRLEWALISVNSLFSETFFVTKTDVCSFVVRSSSWSCHRPLEP